MRVLIWCLLIDSMLHGSTHTRDSGQEPAVAESALRDRRRVDLPVDQTRLAESVRGFGLGFRFQGAPANGMTSHTRRGGNQGEDTMSGCWLSFDNWPASIHRFSDCGPSSDHYTPNLVRVLPLERRPLVLGFARVLKETALGRRAPVGILPPLDLIGR